VTLTATNFDVPAHSYNGVPVGVVFQQGLGTTPVRASSCDLQPVPATGSFTTVAEDGTATGRITVRAQMLVENSTFGQRSVDCRSEAYVIVARPGPLTCGPEFCFAADDTVVASVEIGFAGPASSTTPSHTTAPRRNTSRWCKVFSDAELRGRPWIGGPMRVWCKR